jgi:AraC-like DNA-binding protein/ligand-binding sensor protein
MDWMQTQTQMLLSFEDLSGITYDYKQLYLPERLRRHVRPFCDYAKHHMKGSRQCPLSKQLANQAAIRAGDKPLSGCCYLGMTDIFRSLWYDNRVMGVFYFGSVIRQGELDQARQRIRYHAQSKPEIRKSLLQRVNKVPCLTDHEIQHGIILLDQMIQTIQLMLDGLEIPKGLYETHASNRKAEEHVRVTHPLIHRAMRMIREQHSTQLNLQILAQTLRCHPGYLSRLFRKQVGMPVSEYLRQVRIDRACRLLRLGRLDITAIGLEVGFDDKSNFGRAFRKVMNQSPGEYQEKMLSY